MNTCELCGVKLNGYNHSEELLEKRILKCNPCAGIKPKLRLQTLKQLSKQLKRS